MESEIQFLLDLVLNHKLTTDAKKRCLERIGQVEESLRTRLQPSQQPGVLATSNRLSPQPGAQAPSTQRILDEMTMVQPPVQSPLINVNIPEGSRDKETGLVNKVTSVTAGGSTRGPSKVFR